MKYQLSKKQNTIPEKQNGESFYFLWNHSAWCIFTFIKKLKEAVDGLFQDPATLSNK